MRIAGFIKTTLLDWDGMVACTVYLPGCNFRCPYCHNRDILTPADDYEFVDESSVLQYVEENADFLDGVVISGGEPTLQKDLVHFIKELRRRGMKIKLDTNGTNPDVLEDLLGASYLDYVAMDVKAPLEGDYRKASGVDTDEEALRRSIGIIIDSGVDHEFRTTVVPIIIKEEDVESISRSIKGAKRYVLQQFRPDVTLDENLSLLRPYPESRVLELAKKAKGNVTQVRLRGL